MNKRTTQVSPKLLSIPHIIYLPDNAIERLISNNSQQIRTAITDKDLNGSRFDYDVNHDPVMGVVNNKFINIFIKGA